MLVIVSSSPFVLRPLANNYVTGLVLQQADLLEHLWSKYMPDALRSGELKCLPPAEFVGRGLESVQGACDLMSKGVSGKKLVVRGI